MKTKEEIEQLAEKEYPLKVVSVMEGYEDANRFERIAFTKAYTQCQEDVSNNWSKGCECKDSIGQTWCCNQCGLPYDTRKSDKKYTEQDIRNAINVGISAEAGDYPKGWSFKLGISLEDYFINSLNKQD